MNCTFIRKQYIPGCLAIVVFMTGCDATDPTDTGGINPARRLIQSFEDPCNYEIVNQLDGQGITPRVTPRAWLVYMDERGDYNVEPMNSLGNNSAEVSVPAILEGSSLEVLIYLNSPTILGEYTNLVDTPNTMAAETQDRPTIDERLVASAIKSSQPNVFNYEFDSTDFTNNDCAFWAERIYTLCITNELDTSSTSCHRPESS